MHAGRKFMERFWYHVKNLVNAHANDKTNPHEVTKAQIGLGSVENKSSAMIRGEMTSGDVTGALGYTPLDAAKKGVANGVAELDTTGKVPSAQLPSFVDDVIEGYLSGGKFYKEASHTTQIAGESGKIYIDLTSSKTYRWSGSTFVEISQSLALGETSTTAYRGDRGKAAYDHTTNKSNPHGVTKAQVGLGNVPNVATDDQTPTFTAVDEDTALVSGEKLSTILGKIARTVLSVISLKEEVAGLNGNLENIFVKPSTHDVDYNTLTAGIHYCGDNCTHAPTSYCRVICLYSGKNPGRDALQIAFAISERIFFVRTTNSSGAWTDWKKIVPVEI